MIACTTCFLVEDKDGSLTVATRHHFQGKKATCDPLGVAGTLQTQWAFRRLCVVYEVVFYRRELNSVFMTVGDAYSMLRFPSRSRWSCQGSRHCCPLYRPA